MLSRLLQVEQPENQTAFKLTPRSGKSKRISAFQDYGDGGRNEDRLRNYSLTDGIPLVWSIGEDKIDERGGTASNFRSRAGDWIWFKGGDGLVRWKKSDLK